MHHFYLWGKLDNETLLPVIPGVEAIKKSYVRYNGEKWSLHIDTPQTKYYRVSTYQPAIG